MAARLSNATLASVFQTFDLDKNDRLNSTEFLALIKVCSLYCSASMLQCNICCRMFVHLRVMSFACAFYRPCSGCAMGAHRRMEKLWRLLQMWLTE